MSSSSLGLSSSSVQVVVRLRPLNDEEKLHGTLPVVSASTANKSITVLKGKGGRQEVRNCYTFDNVFAAFSTQEEVFKATLEPVISDVMKGFESTVFAYGQTGTGKTYTMEGDLGNPDNYGVIPRAACAIFDKLSHPSYTSSKVLCSYLEIYNEELSDLLLNEPFREEDKKINKLEIMEGKKGTFCRNLSQELVTSADDVLTLMQNAQHLRKIGETKMNKHSSRSHCIFTIEILATKELSDGTIFDSNGKLHMVDLAGSECAKSASLDKVSGNEVARERERMNINRSLLTLGRVINMLKTQSDSKKANHVRIPYRDSKLTRILQESLGGRCKTVVIATLSPSVTAMEESVSTLNYAQAANGIINKPVASSSISMSNSSMSFTTHDSSQENSITVDHWHEMELRLKYAECQLEEAQGALARKHIQHQELTDRVEKAEKLCIEAEAKYESAKKEIKKKEKEIIAEKEQNARLTMLLREKDVELKKTTAILEATQKTEVNLTAEGTSLLQTLFDSIRQGDSFHKDLIKLHNLDKNLRKSGCKFRADSKVLIESSHSVLNKLSEKEDEHRGKLSKVTQEGYDFSIKTMNEFLEFLSHIGEDIAKVMNSCEERLSGKDGVNDMISELSTIISKFSVEANTTVSSNEENLLNAIERLKVKLVNHSIQMEQLKSDYYDISKETKSRFEENITVTRNKVSSLLSSLSDNFSKINDEANETRNQIQGVIGEVQNNVMGLSQQFEENASADKVLLEEAVKIFSLGMKHHDDVRGYLASHNEYINTSSSGYFLLVKELEKKLQMQAEALAQAKQDQENNNRIFIDKVMSGVKELVQIQMTKLQQKQIEYLNTFSNNNSSFLRVNDDIGSKAQKIFDESKDTCSLISKSIEDATKNDEIMKEASKRSIVTLSELEALSRRQQEALLTQMDRANKCVEDLDTQEQDRSKAMVKAKEEGMSLNEYLSNATQEDTLTDISRLAEKMTDQVNYANSNIISGVQTDVAEITTDRTCFVPEIKSLIAMMKSKTENQATNVIGMTKKQIVDVNQLQNRFYAKTKEYQSGTINIFRSEACSRKEHVIKELNQFSSMHKGDVSSALTGMKSVEDKICAFVQEDVHCDENAPPVPSKTTFNYSTVLSSTPSADTIIKNLNLDMDEDVLSLKTTDMTVTTDITYDSLTGKNAVSFENSDHDQSSKSDEHSQNDSYSQNSCETNERECNDFPRSIRKGGVVSNQSLNNNRMKKSKKLVRTNSQNSFEPSGFMKRSASNQNTPIRGASKRMREVGSSSSPIKQIK